MFEKKIYGILSCPRCNARAELRNDHMPLHENRVFLYIVCDKCKLTQYHSTTTKRALKILEEMRKLQELLERQSPTSSAATATRGRIESLWQRYNRAELGIGA